MLDTALIIFILTYITASTLGTLWFIFSWYRNRIKKKRPNLRIVRDSDE